MSLFKALIVTVYILWAETSSNLNISCLFKVTFYPTNLGRGNISVYSSALNCDE